MENLDREYKRRITYYITMKVRMTEKYQAKMADYDEKIAALRSALAEMDEN